MTEVPLTKAQRNHLANMARRDAKRKRATSNRNDAKQRDAQLREVNDAFLPKIRELERQHKAELKKVWDEWREARSVA